MIQIVSYCAIVAIAFVVSAQAATPKNCGPIGKVADRIETCASPLLDLLEGKTKDWPDDVKDIQDLCGRISSSEKCIRDTGRECLTGVKRTLTSSLSNAVQRARKRECVEKNFPQLLKATKCAETNQGLNRREMNNITLHMVTIRDTIFDLDTKTTAICCIIKGIGPNIEHYLKPFCIPESKTLVRLFDSAFEDVNGLICRSVSCDNFKLKAKKTNVSDGFLSTLMEILFSLDGSNE